MRNDIPTKKENCRPILRIHVVHVCTLRITFCSCTSTVRLTVAKARTRIILSCYPTTMTFGRISEYHVRIGVLQLMIDSICSCPRDPDIYLQIGRNRTLAFKIIHAPGTQLHQGHIGSDIIYVPLQGKKKNHSRASKK